MEVGCGECGDLFRGNSAQPSEALRGVDHQGRLVLPAAVRNGREERRIGFDQNAVGGSRHCNLAQADGLGIGEVAGEGEIEAEVERVAGLLDGSGEAVQDTGGDSVPRLGVPVGLDQFQHVFPGIGCGELFFGFGRGQLRGPAMDQDGLARCCGHLHLGDEGGALHSDWRVLDVVVVEADLANGNDVRVCCKGG